MWGSVWMGVGRYHMRCDVMEYSCSILRKLNEWNPTSKSLLNQKLMLFNDTKKKSDRRVKITQKKVEGLDRYPAFYFVSQQSQWLAVHASTQRCPYRQEDSPRIDVPLEWLVSTCSLTHTLKPFSLCCSQPGSGCHPRGPSHRGHCDTGAGCSSYGQEKSDCEEVAHCRNLRWVCKRATGFGHSFKFNWGRVSLSLIFILSLYFITSFNCFFTYYSNIEICVFYLGICLLGLSNPLRFKCYSMFLTFFSTLVTVRWSGAVVY